MKLNAAYARQMRADYANFLKEEGVTEPESHHHPMKMGIAMGKVVRKYAVNHEDDMFPFRKFFDKTFKIESAVIRRGNTSGARENSGQTAQAQSAGR